MNPPNKSVTTYISMITMLACRENVHVCLFCEDNNWENIYGLLSNIQNVKSICEIASYKILYNDQRLLAMDKLNSFAIQILYRGFIYSSDKIKLNHILYSSKKLLINFRHSYK